MYTVPRESEMQYVREAFGRKGSIRVPLAVSLVGTALLALACVLDNDFPDLGTRVAIFVLFSGFWFVWVFAHHVLFVLCKGAYRVFKPAAVIPLAAYGLLILRLLVDLSNLVAFGYSGDIEGPLLLIIAPLGSCIFVQLIMLVYGLVHGFEDGDELLAQSMREDADKTPKNQS